MFAPVSEGGLVTGTASCFSSEGCDKAKRVLDIPSERKCVCVCGVQTAAV